MAQFLILINNQPIVKKRLARSMTQFLQFE